MTASPAPRITTATDRFEISDPTCGVVALQPNRLAALRLASIHSCTDVTVFDRMARRGDTRLWSAQGDELERRQ